MKTIDIEIYLLADNFSHSGYNTSATLRATYDKEVIDKFEIRDNNGRDITDLLTQDTLDYLTGRYIT